MRNILRSPIRSGAIVLILAISIGLILAMLAAQTSVNAKIAEVKATTATEITVNPAGIRGGMGGGDPLTAEQAKIIANTANVSKTASTLTDQLGTEDTNLTPSLELGSFGKRMQRFETREDSPSSQVSGGTSSDSTPATPQKAPTPRTTVTGTTDPATTVPSSKLTSGTMIDGNSSEQVALVGKTLAEKNNLTIGSTFTMYGQTITIKGIFSLDNAFLDSGILLPLATLQTLTAQPGSVSSITVTANSSDNVAGVVAALKTSLGDKADVTSQQEQAANSLQPLEAIAGLASSGVVGAAIAASVIVLVSMIMIVRERRREIGVIKAIGGTNRSVITQFITEAVTLTLISTIIGFGLGVAASGPLTQSLVTSGETNTASQGPKQVTRGGGFPGSITQLNANLTSITSTLTPQVFAGSLGIIVLIAIVGSAAPAWAISRVRPAEVLRTE